MDNLTKAINDVTQWRKLDPGKQVPGFLLQQEEGFAWDSSRISG